MKQTIFVIESENNLHTVWTRATMKAIAVKTDLDTAFQAMRDYMDGKEVPEVDEPCHC